MVYSVTFEDKSYAVKVYRKGRSNKDYFDNEFKICAALNENRFLDGSKYVINYVDAFSHLHIRGDKTTIHPCIVYSLLGDSLTLLLDYVGGGLAFDVVRKVTREILSGLAYLHSLGIIHTDLKPDNILLTHRIGEIGNNSEISVVIADVGSSTFRNKIFSKTIGTQEYESPEAVLGQDYDTPTDIWSLGCIVYEIATGDVLFDLSGDDIKSESDGYDTEDSSDLSRDVEGGDDAESHDSEYDTCWKHMAIMQSFLGPVPQTMLRGGSQFHNNRGNLRGNPRIDKVGISEKILREFEGIDENAAGIIENVVLRMLQYHPQQRPTAIDLLQSPLLQGPSPSSPM